MAYNVVMTCLDYRTAGESHGPGLIVLVEGLPSGLHVDLAVVDESLRRRQGGFGRSGRMQIERDHVEVISGLRSGMTTGAPLTLLIRNKDNRLEESPPIHRPRPGHADMAGAQKWLTTDCRNAVERASARETAARVAAGAVAMQLLAQFDIHALGYVVQIGEVPAQVEEKMGISELARLIAGNEVYCPDSTAAEKMIAAIGAARKDRDTLGGVIEVRVEGMPAGLGNCVRWQDKLDGRIMGAVGAVQAIKGVEIGLGFAASARPGSRVHDEIDYVPGQRSSATLGFVRRTNNAGGIEGGMTNGMPLVVRAAMKPISTLLRGLDSIDLQTLSPQRSDYERSDICAVPAASVVVEHVVAFEVARAFVDKFGGDTLGETRAHYDFYLAAARKLAGDPQGGE